MCANRQWWNRISSRVERFEGIDDAKTMVKRQGLGTTSTDVF